VKVQKTSRIGLTYSKKNFRLTKVLINPQVFQMVSAVSKMTEKENLHLQLSWRNSICLT